MLAVVPELVDLCLLTDLEALEEKGSLEPRPVQLGHKHARHDIGRIDLYALSRHPLT